MSLMAPMGNNDLAAILRRRRRGAASVLFKYVSGDAIGGGTFARTGVATYYDANGILQTAATGVIRDGNYVGALRTTWLEDTRTNVAIQGRDWTQAAWVAVGITPALTATGIDGAANSASTLTAGGAVTNTILQTVTHVSSTDTFSVSLKRITGTGTISICVDGSTFTTVTLTPAWQRFSVSQATVTNPVFGVQMGTQNDVIAADYGQCEVAAFMSSPILTTTLAVPRNADSLNFPYRSAPQASTYYVKFVDVGTVLTNNLRVFQINQGGTNVNALRVIANATKYTAILTDGSGTTTSSSDTASAPVIGDTVELLITVSSAGVVTIGMALNGGALVSGTAGAAGGLPTMWGSGAAVLNLDGSSAATNTDFMALARFTALGGVQTLGTAQAA